MIARPYPLRLTRHILAPARDPIPAKTCRAFREVPARRAYRITPAAIALACALAVPSAAQRPSEPTPYQRAIAAGYKAAMYCSGIFSAGRTSAQIDRDELAGIYAEYEAIVPTLTATVDRKTASVTVAYDPVMPPRRAAWQPGTGCVTERIGLAAPAAPATFRRPPAPVKADPRPWPQGDRGIAPRPAPPLAAAVGRAFDGSHGAGAKTTGVIVLRDGAVMAERYAAGWGPFVSNRTWSAGKSLAGTLIGWAAGSANGPVPLRPNTGYLWPRAGDPRGAITLDHLLRMASGLHSDTAGNRTDAIYFGGTAVDEQALGWPLAARPGTRFRYANNDTLLAVYMMRLAIGEDRYRAIPTDFLATLGMTHTQPGTDWRGNYILSSQVWSTARDLARLGQFWLQDGVWQGKRLLPAGWIRYMSSPSGPQPASGPGYGATLWLFGPKQGLPEGSYAAQGNRGQYIMVIPSAQLVIVRRGEDPGSARFDIAKFAADVLAAAP